MKIKITTSRNGINKTSFASVEPKMGDLRRPMKKAALSAMRDTLADHADVAVQCEQCGGDWKSIMTVGPTEQPGQFYDTFNQHVH